MSPPQVEIDGETWCLEQESGQASHPLSLPESPWKALVLLVPMRLGTEGLNPLYSSCLKALFTLDSCLGIIGGRPRHSLYFVGFQVCSLSFQGGENKCSRTTHD